MNEKIKKFNIPVYDEYFIGRSNELDAINMNFNKNNESLSIQALVGMGGVGKSSIARKYANDEFEGYNLIWWFDSENVDQLKIQYLKLAKILDVDIDSKDIYKISNDVNIKLNEMKKCLLIFDNVEEYEDIKPYLCRKVHILVTTRNRQLHGIMKKNIIPIDVFNDIEAENFILNRLELEDTNYNKNLAKNLVGKVEYLPLLLEQAVSYIENDITMDLKKYLELFEKYSENNEIYDYLNELDVPENYHNKITVTWQITFDKIKNIEPKALNVIYICSVLCADNISYVFLENSSEEFKEKFWKSDFRDSSVILKDILNIIYKYSIISWDKKNLNMRMHRIVQCIVRGILNKENKLEEYQNYTLDLLNDTFNFSENNDETWSYCRIIFPHIKFILKDIDKRRNNDFNNFSLYHLYCKMKDYSYSFQNFEDTKKYILKKIEFDKVIFKEDEEVYESNLNNLGHIYERMGDIVNARKTLEDCLILNKKNHVPPDDTTATALNNLGLLELKNGNQNEANAKFNEALSIDLIYFGEDSEAVFIDLNNIGLSEIKIEDYKSAKNSLERALKIGKKCFNEKNIKLSATYENLSVTLVKLGDYENALNNLKKSNQMLKDFYGSYNDKIVNQMLCIAGIMDKIDSKASVTQYEDAFNAARDVYKENEKEFIVYIQRLNDKYFELEDYKKANKLLKEAKEIINTYFNDNILLKTEVLRDLAETYNQEKDYENATINIEEMLKIPENNDIKINTQLINDRTALLNMYLKLEKFNEAIQQCEILIQLNKTFKNIDYNTIIELSTICSVFMKKEKLYEEALEKEKYAYELNCKYNSTTKRISENAKYLNNIGYIYNLKGDKDNAKKKYKEAIEIIKKYADVPKSNQIDIYLNLGDVLLVEELYEEAKSNYKLALNIVINSENLDDIKKCYLALSQFALKKHDMGEVASLYKNILELDKKKHVDDEVIDDLKVIISATCKNKKLKDAIPYIKERLMLIEKLYGKNNKEYNDSYNLLNKIEKKLSEVGVEEKNMVSKYLNRNQAEIFSESCNILIITATDLETKHFLEKVIPLPNQKDLLISTIKSHTYTIGKFGSFSIVHVQSQPGAVSSNASLITTKESIEFWKPKIVIMVGIAFGVNNEKNNIGDVIVSRQVCPYEIEKITQDKEGNKVIIRRNPIVEAGNILSDRFTIVRDWNYTLENGKNAKIVAGQLLSGEKLINNIEFKENLMSEFPEAVGGEMEATGVYVAAKNCNCNEWIVVKGICDWADGNKDVEKEKNQMEAINSAVDLCEHVLNNPYSFEDIDVKSIMNN